MSRSTDAVRVNDREPIQSSLRVQNEGSHERLEGKGAVALGEFERHTGHGGGSPMLDGQDDTIVTVAAKVEGGSPPRRGFRRSAQGLPGTHGTGALSGMVDDRDGDGMA